MKPKKVLISEDTQSIKITMEHVNEVVIPSVKEVVSLIKEMNVGPVTYDLTVDALFHNSSKIGSRYNEIAMGAATGIINPVLIKNLQFGIGEVMTNFRTNITNAILDCDKQFLHGVAIENEEPVLTEKYLEDIKEMFRRYASPEEAEFYNLHKKAANVLDEFFVNVKSTLTNVDIARVFKVENDKIIPNPDTRYEYLLKREPAVSE